MSLCDRREAHNRHESTVVPEAPLTPVAREAAQEAVLARWLAREPHDRNRRLAAERDRQGVTHPDVPTYPLVRAQVYTVDGISRTIRQWAAATGWEETTIRTRLARGLPLTENPERDRWVA